MRLLIADLFSSSHIDSLKAQGFEVLYNDKLNGESLQEALSTFDPHILVVRSTKVQANHFTAAKSLEAVIRAGSGYDTIDKSCANSRGVFVANCPGKNAVAVAELTLGLILSIDRKIPSNDLDLKQKKWNKGEYSNSRGIKGRTLGIIGYGNIGHEVATRALSFDMEVIVFSRTKPNPADPRIRVAASMDEILSVSDIVSIHLPQTSVTKELVNEGFLKRMKKDAVLINTSRGSLVVEKHLLAHLTENPGFFVGTDVFMDEPADKKGAFASELAMHPQVVGTHHIGASTKQAEDAIGQEAYRMIVEYQRTGVMPNCVNMGSGLKTGVITLKFNNKVGFQEELWAVLSKLKIRSLESKTEVFEGGNIGLCVMKVEENGARKEAEEGLKGIKDIVSFKWE